MADSMSVQQGIYSEKGIFEKVYKENTFTM